MPDGSLSDDSFDNLKIDGDLNLLKSDLFKSLISESKMKKNKSNEPNNSSKTKSSRSRSRSGSPTDSRKSLKTACDDGDMDDTQSTSDKLDSLPNPKNTNPSGSSVAKNNSDIQKRSSDTVVISNEQIPIPIPSQSQDTSPRYLMYEKGDKGPYLIHIQRQSEDAQQIKPLLTLQVSRLLDRAGIKYDLLESLTRRTWIASFNSLSAANSAVENAYLRELQLTATIPSYQIFRKGVIRGIPNDYTIPELITSINYDNKSVKAVEGYRLKRRTVKQGVSEWVETSAVCITFRNRQLPEEIFVERTVLKVDTFIPSIKQCYKCGKIGHLRKCCRSEEKCLNCNQDRHPEGTVCQSTPMCINCSGNHRTTNSKCPKIQESVAINKIMAQESIPFISAKRIYDNQAGVTKVPNNNLKNFPNLMTPKSPPFSSRNFPPQSSPIAYNLVAQAGSGNKHVRLESQPNPTQLAVNHLPDSLTQANLSEINKLSTLLNSVHDVDKLWARIWNTIELHLLLPNNATESRANKNRTMELSEPSSQTT